MLIDCTVCSAVVDGMEEASYAYQDAEMGIKELISLLHCPRCLQPIVALQTDWGEGWDTPSRVYPQERIRIDPFMPKPIQSAFSEALQCFKTGSFTAAAIMCRKTLEGVCVDFGQTAGSLAARLKALKDNGRIEARLYDWADALRLSGNDAAHDVNVTVSKEDARDMIEFTFALTEYLFTYRRRFEEYAKRRGAKKPSKAARSSSAPSA